MTNEAASLQNLHDIVVPGPVGWWPPAPGWYVLAVIVAGALLVLAWRGWGRWRRNRYRGQALRELARIRRGEQGAGLRELPVLLKRAALSAWPRDAVAGLAGPAWHRFLDDTASMQCFTAGMGALLERLAYAGPDEATLSEPDRSAVLGAARRWLKQHRAPGGEA